MYNKVSMAPFTDFTKSASLRTLIFWAALLPQIVMLFVTKSWQSLIIILSAVLGAALSEADAIADKGSRRIAVARSLFVGTLIGFFLPPSYPPASVFLITLVFLFMTKSVFGSAGVSWLNPVAVTVTAAWFMGRTAFGGFEISGAELLAKNPSLALIDGAMLTNGVDEKITMLLNDGVFRLFNVSIPNGYVSLFWDSHAAIPACRFTFLTLLSSLFLFAFDLKKPELPLLFLFLYFCLVKFASPLITGAAPMSGDVLLALLSSGLLFASVFALQWPGTSPTGLFAKIVCAILAAAIAFVFCGTGTSPAGAAATILFANLLSPALQVFESKRLKKRLSILLAAKLGEANQ